jgi:hypothetical protein
MSWLSTLHLLSIMEGLGTDTDMRGAGMSTSSDTMEPAQRGGGGGKAASRGGGVLKNNHTDSFRIRHNVTVTSDHLQ